MEGVVQEAISFLGCTQFVTSDPTPKGCWMYRARIARRRDNDLRNLPSNLTMSHSRDGNPHASWSGVIPEESKYQVSQGPQVNSPCRVQYFPSRPLGCLRMPKSQIGYYETCHEKIRVVWTKRRVLASDTPYPCSQMSHASWSLCSSGLLSNTSLPPEIGKHSEWALNGGQALTFPRFVDAAIDMSCPMLFIRTVA